jgi:peptidoglycan/LPS O-acetylase OafA/YrhL
VSTVQVAPLVAAPVKQHHLPALDGIRAISAWGVVFAHIGALPRSFGALGVTVFFVLSGFLITTLLLRETEETGTVSLKDFYMRRTLRIFPAFYVFLLAGAAFCLFASVPIDWNRFAANVIYMGDYYAALALTPGAVFGVAWSLGIEEKFYLIWPSVFRRYRYQVDSLIRISLWVAVGCSAYRALLWFGFGVRSDYLRYAFESRLDALMIGCLAAMCIHSKRPIIAAIQRRKWLPAVLAVAIIALTAAQGRIGSNLDYSIGITVCSILIAAVLIGLMANADTYGFLDTRPMRFLGKLSYSTYLYQFIAIELATLLLPKTRWSVQILAAAAVLTVLAFLSYCFIEKPLLTLKKRYERAGTKQKPLGSIY